VTEREEILWPADRLIREIEAVLNLFESKPSPETGAESLQAEAEQEGWFEGPPYRIPEVVFNEDDLDDCEPA
jgi:hypothetical protein